MIVCRTCGGHNADGDTFCGSCGEFLEWTGEKLAVTSEQAEPPVQEPIHEVPGQPTSARRPAVIPEPPAEPTPVPPEPRAGPAAHPGPAPAATGAPGPDSPSAGRSAAPPASALVAPPGAGSEPASTAGRPAVPPTARRSGPQEMRPQAPGRRHRPTAPVVASPPTRRLQPDDLICGMCGEGNPPDRRFCRRCGESLQTATVVPTPWWRKVLQYLRRRRVHSAGARPKRRARLLTLHGVMALVRRALLVAALLAALAYAGFPGMRQGVNGVVGSLKDRVVSAVGRQPVKVVPIRTEATAQLPDHPGELATDQFSNTFWVAPDASAGPKLILTFDHPAHLTQAIVHNGGGEDYQALGRPAKLHVVAFDGDSPVGITDVVLEDTPNEQKVGFDTGEGANRVEIEVVGVHRSARNPGLALSYLELFERPS